VSPHIMSHSSTALCPSPGPGPRAGPGTNAHEQAPKHRLRERAHKQARKRTPTNARPLLAGTLAP
jgi:hypothetical protein